MREPKRSHPSPIPGRTSSQRELPRPPDGATHILAFSKSVSPRGGMGRMGWLRLRRFKGWPWSSHWISHTHCIILVLCKRIPILNDPQVDGSTTSKMRSEKSQTKVQQTHCGVGSFNHFVVPVEIQMIHCLSGKTPTGKQVCYRKAPSQHPDRACRWCLVGGIIQNNGSSLLSIL